MAKDKKAAFEIRQRDGRRFIRRKRDEFAVIDENRIERPAPKHTITPAALIGTKPQPDDADKGRARRQTVICALNAAMAIALTAAFIAWQVTERTKPVSGVEANGVQTALLQDTTPAEDNFSYNIGELAIDKAGRTFFHVTLVNESDRTRDVTMTLSATLEGTDAQGGNWTTTVDGIRADAAVENVVWHEDRIHVINVEAQSARGFDLYPSLENLDMGTAKPKKIAKIELKLDQSAPSEPQRRRVATSDLKYRQYLSDDGKSVIVSGEFTNDTGQPMDKAKMAVWFIDTSLETSGVTEPLGKDAPKGLRIEYVDLGHIMTNQTVTFEGKFAVNGTKAAQARVAGLIA